MDSEEDDPTLTRSEIVRLKEISEVAPDLLRMVRLEIENQRDRKDLWNAAKRHGLLSILALLLGALWLGIQAWIGAIGRDGPPP